jgi:hypothetical protein
VGLADVFRSAAPRSPWPARASRSTSARTSGVEYIPRAAGGRPATAAAQREPHAAAGARDAPGRHRALHPGPPSSGVEVPYVVVGDLDVSIEWTARNLDPEPGQLRILVNGASPFFAYEPSLLVVDPEEDPTPPPLLGDVPIDVPALGEVSGVFREDQLREASIDLELITRGQPQPVRRGARHPRGPSPAYQPMTPLDPDNPDVEPMPRGQPDPDRGLRPDDPVRRRRHRRSTPGCSSTSCASATAAASCTTRAWPRPRGR